MNNFSTPTFTVTDFLVTQNLSVLGDEVIFNTVTTTTSALSVTNDGTGPALYVQQNGSQPIAHFIDVNGDDVVIDDTGRIAIGTLSASEKLTVVGNISSTDTVASLSGHFANNTNAAYLDIFSCKWYDVEKMVEFSKNFYEADSVMYKMSERK